MSRRTVAALAAVLLAVLGGFLVLSYVSNADVRARDGEDLADVLVVDSEIAAGTEAAALADLVSTEQVPSRLVAPGAITDLSDVAGQVVTSPLLPGDQVVTGRFAAESELLPEGTEAAPEGTVEVSVTLDGQRAVGGVLAAGDRVGVQLTSQETGTGLGGYSIYRVLPNTLVTRVLAPTDTTDPTAVYTVTLAVSAADATDLILGSTASAVWLSLEKAGVPGGTSTTTQTATLGDDS